MIAKPTPARMFRPQGEQMQRHRITIIDGVEREQERQHDALRRQLPWRVSLARRQEALHSRISVAPAYQPADNEMRA